MIVAPNKTYRIEYQGEIHKLHRKNLVALNDRLAASWAISDPARRRKLWRILMELNWPYIKACTYQFACDMDREDWESRIIRYIPDAIAGYDSSKGHFHTYIVGWKRAAFSRWLDARDTVRLPQNQRQTLGRLKRKVAKIDRERALNPQAAEQLTQKEVDLLEKIQLTTLSLNAPTEGGEGSYGDRFVGEDARDNESLGVRYGDIWVRIRSNLEPFEFTLFLWYYHEDHQLNMRDIGNRVNLSHERVRQILDKVRDKLKKRMGKFSDWMGG